MFNVRQVHWTRITAVALMKQANMTSDVQRERMQGTRVAKQAHNKQHLAVTAEREIYLLNLALPTLTEGGRTHLYLMTVLFTP